MMVVVVVMMVVIDDDDDNDEYEEEEEEDFEDEVPLKARKVAKQAKGRAAAVSKEKEPEVKQKCRNQIDSFPLNLWSKCRSVENLVIKHNKNSASCACKLCIAK